jgi:hypothetical protein
MSWTNVHLARDDEIRTDIASIPRYVQLLAGDALAIVMPREKAAEVYVALGEALAATPPDDQDPDPAAN